MSATLRPPRLRAKLAAPPPESPRLPALLAAAEAVFLAKGYHEATMNDVARQAGMSKKTVYELITSKPELLSALLSHRQTQLELPAYEEGWSLHEALTANLLALARFTLAPPQIALTRLIMTEVSRGPELGRQFLRRHLLKAKTQLTEALAASARMPLHEPPPDYPSSKDLTAMLLGMAIGEFHIGMVLGFHTPPPRRKLELRVTQAVTLFLAGCEAMCPTTCQIRPHPPVADI
jgi:AcrR family transcriptional regulator